MNDDQKRLAQASKERLEKDGKTVETAIEPFTSFTRAEQYHQKYTLRANNAFVKELKRYYSDERDLENSTSAARLNGYLAGDGKASLFEEEIGKLGLSADHQKLLRERVKGRLQKDDEVAPAECGAGAEEVPAGKK
jgi:peptide-methionine (S)-S-oxide reductase